MQDQFEGYQLPLHIRLSETALPVDAFNIEAFISGILSVEVETAEALEAETAAAAAAAAAAAVAAAAKPQPHELAVLGHRVSMEGKFGCVWSHHRQRARI